MPKPPSPPVRTAGRHWLLTGDQHSVNHVTSLPELLEHRTHFLYSKNRACSTYINVWGKHTSNIHRTGAGPGNGERGLSLLGQCGLTGLLHPCS